MYLGLNTAVGAYGGYLAEGAATQLCLDPRDMTTANWVLGATMTRAKTSTGIDGIANSATRLTGGAVTGTNTILQTLVAASTSRTYSAWVRRVTGTGTITLLQGTASLDITALINSTTYTLVQLNDNELNVAYGLQIATNGDAIDVDCNQFEAGAIASTPIPSAGTRNSDVLTYPMSGNMSNSAGTFYAKSTPIVQLSTLGRTVWSIDDGTANERISTEYRAAGLDDLTFNLTDGGVSQFSSDSGSISTSGNKIAFAYQVNDIAVAEDGAILATDSSATMPTTTTIRIGVNQAGGAQLAGMIQECRGWQRRLPDATLQTITAP